MNIWQRRALYVAGVLLWGVTVVQVSWVGSLSNIRDAWQMRHWAVAAATLLVTFAAIGLFDNEDPP